MKNRFSFVIVLLLALLMLPSPCRTQAAETADVSPARYVTAVSGIPADGALGINVTVAQNAAGAAFRLEYNENVLEFRDLWATENFALQYDLSHPGVLKFSAEACSPTERVEGELHVVFNVKAKGDLGLALRGEEYVGSDGARFTTKTRERFLCAATPDRLPEGIPAGFDPGSIRLGDPDFSQTVTADDARSILRFAVRIDAMTEAQALCADMDGDGRVTAGDARLALRESVGL